ncbi:hypothetical protein FRC12_013123 [Ceratobasidium sp. 428]|nr:hypothetical protein FRC12_013123 [Ceratobasidium sp. 428]
MLLESEDLEHATGQVKDTDSGKTTQRVTWSAQKPTQVQVTSPVVAKQKCGQKPKNKTLALHPNSTQKSKPTLKAALGLNLTLKLSTSLVSVALREVEHRKDSNSEGDRDDEYKEKGDKPGVTETDSEIKISFAIERDGAHEIIQLPLTMDYDYLRF